MTVIGASLLMGLAVWIAMQSACLLYTSDAADE